MAVSHIDEGPKKSPSLTDRINIDGPLILSLLMLCSLGLLVLYSASRSNTDMVIRQSIHMGIGFVAIVVIAQIHPYYLRMLTPLGYVGGVFLLLIVFFFGDEGKGAQRWIIVGPIRFQPSEIMKIVLPMMVSWYFVRYALPPKITRISVALLLIAIPAALIYKQPDLGTSILVVLSGLFVLFLAGLRWRYIIGSAVLLAVMAPIYWFNYMHAYQKTRVLTFLNPESDPTGAGWNIGQSKIAIGSGGFYGKGWLDGTQSQLEFLPEANTDFIFAVLAEEFGLLGIIILLLLYLFIIYRCLFIALRAQDTFTRLTGGALALTFFVHVFVNCGMVSGLLPVVGMPLPLVSYGGTSVATLLGGFGVLMSIASHRNADK